MEEKRATAFCCLLIVLLSGQLQQVASSAKSKFCGCYKSCYPDCRKHLPRWLCVLKCMDDCSPTAQVLAPTSAVDCDSICQSLSLCGGLTATGTSDVEACVKDCSNNRGAYPPPTAANLH